MFKNNSLNHQKFHNNLHATVTMLSSQIYKPQLSNNDYLLVYCTTKASRYPWVWILSYRKKNGKERKKTHGTQPLTVILTPAEKRTVYSSQYSICYRRNLCTIWWWRLLVCRLDSGIYTGNSSIMTRPKSRTIITALYFLNTVIHHLLVFLTSCHIYICAYRIL